MVIAHCFRSSKAVKDMIAGQDRRTRKPDGGSRSRRRAWLVSLAAAVFFALAAVGAWLVINPTPTPKSTSVDVRSAPAPPSTSTEAPTPVPPTFNTYQTAGWSADLPQGSDWAAPTVDASSPRRIRTTVTGPPPWEVLVDHTPSDAATFSGRYLARRSMAVDGFHDVTAFEFRGGGIAGCRSQPCVDILMNTSADGPGYAILVAGTDMETQRTIAERIAASLVATGPAPLNEGSSEPDANAEAETRAKANAVCAAALDVYHKRAATTSDPVALQVAASRLLAAAAAQMSGDGTAALASALRHQAEVGQRLAIAMEEASSAERQLYTAYAAAGENFGRAARSAGLSSCVPLAGL